MTCLCEHGTEGSTPSPQGCGVYQWTGLSVSPRSISILPLVNHFFFSGSAQEKKKICEEITTVAFLFASVAGEEQLHPLQCIMFTKHLTQRLECAEEFLKKNGWRYIRHNWSLWYQSTSSYNLKKSVVFKEFHGNVRLLKTWRGGTLVRMHNMIYLFAAIIK